MRFMVVTDSDHEEDASCGRCRWHVPAFVPLGKRPPPRSRCMRVLTDVETELATDVPFLAHTEDRGNPSSVFPALYTADDFGCVLFEPR